MRAMLSVDGLITEWKKSTKLQLLHDDEISTDMKRSNNAALDPPPNAQRPRPPPPSSFHVNLGAMNSLNRRWAFSTGFFNRLESVLDPIDSAAVREAVDFSMFVVREKDGKGLCAALLDSGALPPPPRSLAAALPLSPPSLLCGPPLPSEKAEYIPILGAIPPSRREYLIWIPAFI